MNLSVVIPTYKNKKLFLENLKHNLSFLKGCELIIVNDDPEESLKQDLPLLYDRKKVVMELILLENKKNLGFGESVNRGVKKAQGKYIMLLNSDVKLLDDNYKIALKYFKKDKDLFSVSFGQKEKDGSIVGKNRIFWRKGMFLHSKACDLTFGANAWLEGGSCIINREKFLELLGFDPLYSPFYWEDIDLSYRAYKRGWKIIFDPSITVIHHHQSTIGKYFKRSFTEIISFRNQFIFIWKNITDKDPFLSHLFFLPFHFFYFLLKRKKEFFLGFFEAFKKLTTIIKKRKNEVKKAKLKDRQIFKLFLT
jgi:GT2 family glycosyltransferase